jgi:hypothetical protein
MGMSDENPYPLRELFDDMGLLLSSTNILERDPLEVVKQIDENTKKLSVQQRAVVSKAGIAVLLRGLKPRE